MSNITHQYCFILSIISDGLGKPNSWKVLSRTFWPTSDPTFTTSSITGSVIWFIVLESWLPKSVWHFKSPFVPSAVMLLFILILPASITSYIGISFPSIESAESELDIVILSLLENLSFGVYVIIV